jgi:uncharacterized protein YraI
MKRAALCVILILLLLALGMNVLAEFGTNWSGDFYNNTDFSGNPARSVTGINGLNFNWPGQPTVNGVTITEVGADNFSVRFTSSQNFVADTYRFDIAVDDNVRVFIDGAQVFEDFSGGPVKTLSFNQTMTAGTHTLRVDFVEVADAAVIQFQWFQGGAPAGTVAPTQTPIPPLTASVSASVRGLAVRSGPYLGASMVTVAVPGESYPVYAQNASEEGVTWYQINVNGHTGWSSGRYLTFNVENPSAPTAGSVFDGLGNPPDTGTFAAPRAVMNLRAQPSTRTPIIGSVDWGQEVPLLNRTVQGGKNYWFQVRANGVVGWIYAPFVSVHGDINAVPIV